MHQTLHRPLTLLLLALSSTAPAAEPNMLVNKSVAVVSDQFSRWSEGGFLALDDKTLLLVATGYAWNPSNSDNNDASLYAFWSHDGGQTWTPQEQAEWLQTPDALGMQNVMSVSLLKLADGDVLMTFFAYKKGRNYGGTYLRRSTDDGRTWSKATNIGADLVGMPGRNFQLSGGRIIVPVYVEKTGSGVLYSDDGGQSWQRSNTVAGYEPTIVPLNDGRLMMYLRAQAGQIDRSYSEDQGASWSPVGPSGIPAPSSMSTLMRLQNGDLMLIYNMVRDPAEINGPFPRIRLCTMISRDEGKSWGHLRFLDGGDQFVEILKITMASATTIGEDCVGVVWSRSPLHCKPHNNLYDYRYRKFKLDWLYAGDEQLTYETGE